MASTLKTATKEIGKSLSKNEKGMMNLLHSAFDMSS